MYYSNYSEGKQGKLLNDKGEPISFTGMENLVKIEEEFDDAMIRIGLGQILGRDDGREPILCALNESGSNTKVVNERKEKVAKWEDECRKVITHYKSILTNEMKDYARDRSNPKDETSRERLRVIRSLMAEQFNTPTSDRVDFARNKASQLPKVIVKIKKKSSNVWVTVEQMCILQIENYKTN